MDITQFDQITQFDKDVESIIPHRKRYLCLTEEQRQSELVTVISNCSVNIDMQLDHSKGNDYCGRVIIEADRRIEKTVAKFSTTIL